MKNQDEKKVRTLQEEQPEEFAFLLALHAAAIERMEKTDFVRVLPPPRGQITYKPHTGLGTRDVPSRA